MQQNWKFSLNLKMTSLGNKKEFLDHYYRKHKIWNMTNLLSYFCSNTILFYRPSLSPNMSYILLCRWLGGCRHTSLIRQHLKKPSTCNVIDILIISSCLGTNYWANQHPGIFVLPDLSVFQKLIDDCGEKHFWYSMITSI